MFNLYTPELLTIEHNLRVAPVERYGWLRSGTPAGTRLSGVRAALVVLVGRRDTGRVTERAQFSNTTTSAGQAQGAA